MRLDRICTWLYVCTVLLKKGRENIHILSLLSNFECLHSLEVFNYCKIPSLLSSTVAIFFFQRNSKEHFRNHPFQVIYFAFIFTCISVQICACFQIVMVQRCNANSFLSTEIVYDAYLEILCQSYQSEMVR